MRRPPADARTAACRVFGMDGRCAARAVAPVLAFAAAMLCLAAIGHAQTVDQLKELSIEDLGKIEVTSVSKRPEPLSDAPAAIYVINHDDIIRSGATTIPEMLRLAPNLEVAQLTATTYAITARGFNVASNASMSDKLLVLIDGRSVYTPLFAGVYWDMQGVLPENIERIEVISGPGGTLYGERGQRRHQHHHPGFVADAGRSTHARRRQSPAAAAAFRVWRPADRQSHLPHLWRGVGIQPQPEQGRHRRRRFVVAAAGRGAVRLEEWGGRDHRRRRQLFRLRGTGRLGLRPRRQRDLATPARQRVAPGSGVLRRGKKLCQQFRRVRGQYLRRHAAAPVQCGRLERHHLGRRRADHLVRDREHPDAAVHPGRPDAQPRQHLRPGHRAADQRGEADPRPQARKRALYRPRTAAWRSASRGSP